MRDAPPHKLHLTRWRFTLRELGFFVLALSACLALIVQAFPTRPSHLLTNLDWQTLVEMACKEEGIKARVLGTL